MLLLKAMLLAAGLGMRLLPVTKKLKPLFPNPGGFYPRLAWAALSNVDARDWPGLLKAFESFLHYLPAAHHVPITSIIKADFLSPTLFLYNRTPALKFAPRWQVQMAWDVT